MSHCCVNLCNTSMLLHYGAMYCPTVVLTLQNQNAYHATTVLMAAPVLINVYTLHLQHKFTYTKC